MNLRKLFDRVTKDWSNLGFALDQFGKDKLVMSAEIVAKDYFDDNVYCKIVAYDNGCLHVMFTFDKLDPSLENYNLINEFNDNLSWFKAYISEKDSGNKFFELPFASMGEARDKDMASTIRFLLNELLSDSTMKYLKPILEKTV